MDDRTTWPQDLLAARTRIADAHADGTLRAHVSHELAKAMETDPEARVRFLWVAVAILESNDALAVLSDAEFDGMVSTFSMMGAALPTATIAPIKQWFFAMRARTYRRAGQWMSALQAAEASVQSHAPVHTVAVTELAIALSRVGATRAAQTLWEQVPSSPGALRSARLLALPLAATGDRTLQDNAEDRRPVRDTGHYRRGCGRSVRARMRVRGPSLTSTNSVNRAAWLHMALCSRREAASAEAFCVLGLRFLRQHPYSAARVMPPSRYARPPVNVIWSRSTDVSKSVRARTSPIASKFC
jgi:hypothetical protein